MAEHRFAFMTIDELQRAYRARELSPVEVAEAALDSIEAAESHLHAYILVTRERALAAAREAERALRGGDPPPLCGIPYAIKDMFDIAGLPTTCASNVLKGHYVAKETADVVKRLDAAGAVLVGKTNMLEFAYGETHPDFGNTPNPWNAERSTAGSSTGSAATVAAGQVPFAIGTDTGGSVRLPASYCGLTGVKPTYDRISRNGLIALSWSLDHVGSLTRSAADAAAVLDVLSTSPAGASGSDLRSALAGNRRLRVGVIRREFDALSHTQVRELTLRAVEQLADLNFDVEEVSVPPLEEAILAVLTILMVEASAYHRPWLEERPEGYSDAVRNRLKIGMLVPAVDYIHAQRYRRSFRHRVRSVFRHVDLLVLPTSPTPAHAFADEVPGRDLAPYIRLTCPWNFTGLPATSIPCGFTSDGLPVGLQLVADAGRDDLILQAAHRYQQATDWHLRRPPGF